MQWSCPFDRLGLCTKSLPEAPSIAKSCHRFLVAMSSSILAAASSGAPSRKSRRLVSKTSPFNLALLEEVGGEDVGANQRVYLVTFCRALPGMAAATGCRHLSTLTRQDVEGMLRDSFDNPLPLPGTPVAVATAFCLSSSSSRRKLTPMAAHTSMSPSNW